MQPEGEELEPRDNPAPIFARTIVALEIQPQAATAEEAQSIRSRLEGYLIRLAPRGRLEVVIVGEVERVQLRKVADRSQKLQAFVVEFSPGRGPFNFWGEAGEGHARVYAGGHRDLAPADQVPQMAATATHELGHLFGLGHAGADPTDLMTTGRIDPEAAGYANALPVWRALHRRFA